MLHPRIIEITTDKRTGETYVVARFWKTKAARARKDTPFLVEDFVMPLRPAGDPPAKIRGNIRAYIERAEKHGYEGDNTSGDARTGAAFSVGGVVVREAGKLLAEPRERDESDPHGVLAKPEVTALRGKDIDLPAVTP